jgi:hypothetical protein
MSQPSGDMHFVISMLSRYDNNSRVEPESCMAYRLGRMEADAWTVDPGQ